MRTTLNLDDDVLLAVKELAELRRMTAGEVLSELARKALAADRRAGGERNGVPLLGPVEGASLVTPEVVDRLRDEA